MCDFTSFEATATNKGVNKKTLYKACDLLPVNLSVCLQQ